jgi:hypothetical protein
MDLRFQENSLLTWQSKLSRESRMFESKVLNEILANIQKNKWDIMTFTNGLTELLQGRQDFQKL